MNKKDSSLCLKAGGTEAREVEGTCQIHATVVAESNLEHNPPDPLEAVFTLYLSFYTRYCQRNWISYPVNLV